VEPVGELAPNKLVQIAAFKVSQRTGYIAQNKRPSKDQRIVFLLELLAAALAE
jgi:hypothetical protein